MSQKISSHAAGQGNSMQVETFYYDNKIVKQFSYATLFWGVIGMLAGLWAALTLAYPDSSLGWAPTTFCRMSRVHSDPVIFAVVGSAVFAGVHSSMERLLTTRMYSDKLSKLHFWWWHITILVRALTLWMGHTQGKEY